MTTGQKIAEKYGKGASDGWKKAIANEIDSEREANVQRAAERLEALFFLSSERFTQAKIRDIILNP